MWILRRDGNELVPTVGTGAPFGSHRSGEHVQEEQASCGLPSTLVACGGGPPVVRGEASGNRAPDVLGDLADLARLDPTDPFGFFGGVVGVEVDQRGGEVVETAFEIGTGDAQELVPVHPAPHELAIPGAVE